MATAARVRELFDYNPDTGEFHWKVWPSRNSRRDLLAGAHHSEGYIALFIDGETVGAHRVAWLYMTGEWPSQLIDHANGDRADNRWQNLRAATPTENAVNARRPKHNTSGFKGVQKRGQKWLASIRRGRKVINIGRFGTPEEAHAAYLSEAQKMFGDFTRPE